MMLLTERCAQGSLRRIVPIFGIGLIGTSIAQALRREGRFAAQHMPFEWDDESTAKANLAVIADHVSSLIDTAKGNPSVPDLSVVWSAGKAGFSSNDADTERELRVYDKVLEFISSVSQLSGEKRLAFHLVSSLGGLFEGQKNVTLDAQGSPKRPYGRLKLAQERLAAERMPEAALSVYRPTSVYGFPGIGYRMGLIPTLIRNCMCNRVSRIFGSLSTLRDYVLASDIGSFIARSVLQPAAPASRTLHFLASGKPSSILEVQWAVEERMGRKVLLSFDDHPTSSNTSDITVSRQSLPAQWSATDIRTGVNVVAERMYRRGAISVHG